VCLLAKVGEASLKGRNKRHFTEALRRNTRAALRGLDARVEGGGSVFVIPVPDELTAAEAAARLERVFGFVTGSVCLRCERDPERIAEVGLVAFARAQPHTFAVRVRRRDKSFPLTSQEMERRVGAALQRKARWADFRVELYYDWASRRLHPGVLAEARLVRGLGAVVSLTSEAPVGNSQGTSQARASFLLRWYAASGG